MTKIRFGVLGTAKINGAVVPAIHAAKNAECVAIASRDLAKAQAHAQKHEIPQALGSYEALLESDIDAVYIPLPNHLHLPWAKRFLEAGKHVYLEKPACLRPSEVQTLLATAEQYKRVLIEGFMYRHHPQFTRALEIIQSGVLGEIRLVRSSFSFPLEAPENIRWVRSYGGGALYDLGCYCINATLLLLGKTPKRAIASCRQGGVTQSNEYSDLTTSAILEFDSADGNGAYGIFECSIAMPNRQHLEVVGAKGVLELPEFVHPSNEIGTLVLNGNTEKTIRANRYQLLVEHLADVANGEAELQFGKPTDSTNPLAQAKVIEMVQQAMGYSL
ncbi:MAG: Gfo/Idh/MocA family protein [Deinococcales bacterium]